MRSLFFVLAVLLSAVAFAADRPNILWLIADDMSPDVGCYGRASIRTPNLDRLATQGVRFTKMFVNVASCTASRNSFTSGRYPKSMDCGDMAIALDEGVSLLPTMLRPAGYFSGNVGKFHLDAYGPTKHAASQYDVMHNRLEDWRKFLDERPKDRPFFLAVGFHDPHRPYGDAPNVHSPADVFVPPYLVDDPAIRAELVQYYDEIARLDGVVGQIMGRLERDGLSDNTIVVFFADHAFPFLRGKTQVYDSGTHIPFIVRWPGKAPAGGVHEGLQELVNLVPTLCEAAGVKTPEAVHGVSFMPALRDPASPGRPMIFQERNWHGTDDHVRAVRTDRYRYLINAYPDEPMAHPTDLLRGPTFEAMRRRYDAGELEPHRAALFRAPRPAQELYDLQADPHELNNLANDPALASVKDRLREALEAHEKKYASFGPERRYEDKADRVTGEPTGLSKRVPTPRK